MLNILVKGHLNLFKSYRLSVWTYRLSRPGLAWAWGKSGLSSQVWRAAARVNQL